MTEGPSVTPYLSYRNAKAAMKFLADAFGFEEVQSFSDGAGEFVHGEMRYGAGVVMLGETNDKAAKGSPGIYVVVGDVDAHHERARKAGAEIVYGPQDTEFGTRRYRARDLEGHEWSFGTYQPQTSPPDWSG